MATYNFLVQELKNKNIIVFKTILNFNNWVSTFNFSQPLERTFPDLNEILKLHTTHLLVDGSLGCNDRGQDYLYLKFKELTLK